MFTRDSSFFFLFALKSPSSLNETQPYPASWPEVRVIWKRMSKIWGIPSPTNRGPKPIWTTSQLDSKFNGLYLRKKTRYRQSVKCVDNYTWGLLHRPKMSRTLVHKQLQTRPLFYPPYVNSAFWVIARLRRRRSANRTQQNFAKRRTVNRANNVL